MEDVENREKTQLDSAARDVRRDEEKSFSFLEREGEKIFLREEKYSGVQCALETHLLPLCLIDYGSLGIFLHSVLPLAPHAYSMTDSSV